MNMVTRPHAFVPGEWYHCYNRGVEKMTVFKSRADYTRFLALLYLANASNTIHRSDFNKRKLKEILNLPRTETRVNIGAFCLMPNHMHLVLGEKEAGGISSFMLKLMTGYGMYFNIRYTHEGSVFTRPFRSRHISDDRYFQRVIDYTHMNPAELFEPNWKDGSVRNLGVLQEKLIEYPYSSFGAFYDPKRSGRAILDPAVFNTYDMKPLKATLKNALRMYETDF
jgi:putative transposase